MKKLICLIMAVLMAAAGINCFAEGTEGSVTFVRIRENTTADVYVKPGDTEAADTLEGGSLCVLVAETEAAGTVWYSVFYLNSRKEGAIGYIKTGDAEKLSREQLNELISDPNQINKLLDLVEALNDYTDADTGESLTGSKTSGNGEGTSFGSTLEDLYNKAMDELKNLFSMDVAGELEKISEGTKEAADKVTEAGEELLEKAADGVEELLKQAGDALGEATEGLEGKLEKAGEDLKKELEEKLPEAEKALKSLTEGISDALDSIQKGTARDDLDKLLDEVSENLDTLKKNAEEKYAEIEKDIEEKLDILDKNLGKDTGNALDQIKETVGKAQEMLGNGVIQNVLSALGEQFREAGFSEGVNTISTIVQLFSNMQ